jgi:hypothetical protein
MTIVFIAMGVWLAALPKTYLRAFVKYSYRQSLISAKDVESPWWQLAIRALGCFLLAAAAIYAYATFHQAPYH